MLRGQVIGLRARLDSDIVVLGQLLPEWPASPVPQ